MRNIKLILLVIICIITLLTACSKQTPASDNNIETENNITINIPEVIEPEPVELHVVEIFGPTEKRIGYRELIEEFQAMYPHVTITSESKGSMRDGEYYVSIPEMIESGDSGDIFFYYVPHYLNEEEQCIFVGQNLVVPLNEMQSVYPEIGTDISAQALEYTALDGINYGIPYSGYYQGLMVNTALFEAYGLNLPYTWDDLVTAIQVFNDKDVIPMAGQLGRWSYTLEHLVVAEADPSEYLDIQTGQMTEAIIKGLEAFISLYDMQAFQPDLFEDNYDDAMALFKRQEAAMICEGSWSLGSFDEELIDHITVMQMPSPSSEANDISTAIGTYSMSYYLSRSTFENSEKSEWALLLLDHLTTKDAILKMLEHTYSIPSVACSTSEMSPLKSAGFDMLRNADTLITPVLYASTSDDHYALIVEDLPLILQGELTLEEALQKYQIQASPE